ETVLITSPGREHPPGSLSFTREIIDPIPDQGPLRGILTALEATRTDLLVIATCDMPMIENHHFAWLADQLSRTTQSGVFVRSTTIQPFPCALRKSASSLVVDRLCSGDHSVRTLVELAQFELLPAPAHWNSEMWTNLNRPEDLTPAPASSDHKYPSAPLSSSPPLPPSPSRRT